MATALSPLLDVAPGTPDYGWVNVDRVTFVRETEKAVLFDRGGRLAWVPKSQLWPITGGYRPHRQYEIRVTVRAYRRLREQLQ